ncbi:MAG TPA: heparinase II/III family protein [Rhizomicrobium sp.]|nr:heparinase II/III family protein [Rhizomicrobium sp.]
MTTATDSRPIAAARLRVGIVCADETYRQSLSKSLAESFDIVSEGPVLSDRADADVLVYAFREADVAKDGFVADQSNVIRNDAAPTKVFLELVSLDTLGARAKEIADRNTLIAALAHDHGGYLVPLMSKFMRWDPARLLTGDGALNRRGYQAVARTVAKFIDRFDVRRSLDASTQSGRESPSVSAGEILLGLQWSGRDLPRMIKFTPDEGSIADFLDGYASFPSYPNWGRMRLGRPIDWSTPGPNRSWQSYFLGLEFLGPALGLYFVLANDGPLRDAQIFRKLLRRNGVELANVLERIGDVIADFLRANPPDAPMAQRAWHEGTVCRRIKTLLAYLICARSAQRRGERIDELTVTAVFASLRSSIDMLLSERVYIKSGNHGVRQDALVIITALLFEGTEHFRGQLQNGLDRLKHYQLDTMLTEDGVWQENSFEYHRLIMGLLCDLLSDMRVAGAGGMDELVDALARMETFAEAVVKCDGQAPLIGDTTPREALRAIVAAKALVASLRGEEQAGATGKFDRKEETYFFPASGYFVSHSARALAPDVSSLIFYANLSAPKHKHADDLSVLFSHGPIDLLVDGGTYNKETSDDIRNAARFDPATHNTYRVGGKGYSMRTRKGKPLAGVISRWSGEGWEAAHGFNSAYDGGTVDRFVIHLKRHNAFVAVDHLKSTSLFSACDFEQFWHVAPQFRPVDGLRFSSERDGHLLVAFDDGASSCRIEQGGPGNPIAWLMTDDDHIVPTPYIRRARRARKSVMASLFQWSSTAAASGIRTSGNDVEISAKDFSAAFSVRASGVTCLRFEG